MTDYQLIIGQLYKLGMEEIDFMDLLTHQHREQGKGTLLS